MSERIWRVRGMPALAFATVLGLTSYGALLPVAPLWAVEGGAGSAGAGLVNGALLLATVLAQGFVPGAVRRFGWAPVLVAGMVLLGLPAALTGLSSHLGWILAWSAVRGIGFAVLTVCGSTAVAELNAPERRGAAIGAYGLAVAVPMLALLPLGPILAEHVGFWFVFMVSGLPLLGVLPAIALARALPSHAAPDPSLQASARGTRTALRRLSRPTLVLLSTTMAGGAIQTFLPQMISSTILATIGLAVFGFVTALSRWRIGALADRYGAHRFVAPLQLLQIAGLAAAAISIISADEPPVWALLAALAVVAIAYGALQNLTLVLAFAAVPHRQVGTASAVWNVGFDAGTGLSSVLVGLIAARASFSVSLWTLAAFGIVALLLTSIRGMGRSAPSRPANGDVA